MAKQNGAKRKLVAYNFAANERRRINMQYASIKKHGMSLPSETRKKAEAEKPKLDPTAKKIKMLVDEGLNVKVIAKVVDLSRYNVA